MLNIHDHRFFRNVPGGNVQHHVEATVEFSVFGDELPGDGDGAVDLRLVAVILLDDQDSAAVDLNVFRLDAGIQIGGLAALDMHIADIAVELPDVAAVVDRQRQLAARVVESVDTAAGFERPADGQGSQPGALFGHYRDRPVETRRAAREGISPGLLIGGNGDGEIGGAVDARQIVDERRAASRGFGQVEVDDAPLVRRNGRARGDAQSSRDLAARVDEHAAVRDRRRLGDRARVDRRHAGGEFETREGVFDEGHHRPLGDLDRAAVFDDLGGGTAARDVQLAAACDREPVAAAAVKHIGRAPVAHGRRRRRAARRNVELRIVLDERRFRDRVVVKTELRAVLDRGRLQKRAARHILFVPIGSALYFCLVTGRQRTARPPARENGKITILIESGVFRHTARRDIQIAVVVHRGVIGHAARMDSHAQLPIHLQKSGMIGHTAGVDIHGVIPVRKHNAAGNLPGRNLVIHDNIPLVDRCTMMP